MATALAKGIVAAGHLPPEQIFASDLSDESLHKFANVIPGCKLLESNQKLVEQSDLLILAIKPQAARAALGDLPVANPRTVILSVMAGIRIKSLESWLQTPRIIRCMPNTPSLIGRGAIGLAASPAVSAEQLAVVEQLLQSLGLVVRTTEAQLDAVTGLSGSGPAFVFSFIRGLIAGGVASGLSPESARQLALQTLSGATALLHETSSAPEELIAQVTSPGGTTLRGLEVLRSGGFEELVSNCVQAASQRAEELGRAPS
jgi:pyrroline-5-carboxylate reductase